MEPRRPRTPTAAQRAAEQAAERERIEWLIKIFRDLTLFVAGLGLTIREGVNNGPERPSLYIVYVGMMGLGPVLRLAESRSKG